MVYKGCEPGSEARKAAEAKGQVQQFDQVQQLITARGVCPSKNKCYPCEAGHICSGGNHALLAEEVDKWFKDPTQRREITPVKTWFDPNAKISSLSGERELLSLHPPPVDN